MQDKQIIVLSCPYLSTHFQHFSTTGILYFLWLPGETYFAEFNRHRQHKTDLPSTNRFKFVSQFHFKFLLWQKVFQRHPVTCNGHAYSMHFTHNRLETITVHIILQIRNSTQRHNQPEIGQALNIHQICFGVYTRHQHLCSQRLPVDLPR